MRDSRHGGCAMQGKADSICNVRQMGNERQGSCARASQGRYARQGRADERGKARQMRNEMQGSCPRLARAYTRGKAGRMREARSVR
jgi:hypothetical protein